MACLKDIKTFHLTTPIGEMILKTCPRGLHYLSQDENMSEENFFPALEQEVALVEKMPDNIKLQTHVTDCILWLNSYFQNPKKIKVMNIPNICIASEKGSFHERVWLCLAKNIGPGETVSYGELAKMANSPGASQAVGNAMGANHLQLVVPCHRVIRSDGSMGQYAYGKKNWMKTWLLEHEGLKIANNRVLFSNKA